MNCLKIYLLFVFIVTHAYHIFPLLFNRMMSAENIGRQMSIYEMEMEDITKRRRFFEEKDEEALGGMRKKKLSIKRWLASRFACFMKCRWSGIVVGITSGIFIYCFVTFLILDPIEREMAENMKINSQDYKARNIFAVKYRHLIGTAIGGGSAVVISIGSVISRNWRATAFIMFPTIFAKRGKSIMLSAAFGFLLKGPVDNIERNVDTVVKSLICMYDELERIAKAYIEQVNEMKKVIENVLKTSEQLVKRMQDEMDAALKEATSGVRQQLEKAKRTVKEQYDNIKRMYEPVKRFAEKAGDAADIALSIITLGLGGCSMPDFNFLDRMGIAFPKVSLDSLRNMLKNRTLEFDFNVFSEDLFGKLQGKSISDIKEGIQSILRTFFNLLKIILANIEKISYLTILFAYIEARKYVRRYCCDDTFDNQTVDFNLSRLWLDGDKNSNKQPLTPLRNWERDEKFQSTLQIKLSRKEKKALLIQSLPMILFFFLTILVYCLDVVFVLLLDVLNENAQYGFSYDGMESGISFKAKFNKWMLNDSIPTISFRGFNFSTSKCLPAPSQPNYASLWIITFLLILCLISLFLNVYMMRLRLKICNIFFEERATDRALYLYGRIILGRATRRVQFWNLVLRKLEKMERKQKFSFLPQQILKPRYNKKAKCITCGYQMKAVDVVEYIIIRDDGRQPVSICKDCNKDASQIFNIVQGKQGGKNRFPIPQRSK